MLLEGVCELDLLMAAVLLSQSQWFPSSLLSVWAQQLDPVLSLPAPQVLCHPLPGQGDLSTQSSCTGY